MNSLVSKLCILEKTEKKPLRNKGWLENLNVKIIEWAFSQRTMRFIVNCILSVLCYNPLIIVLEKVMDPKLQLGIGRRIQLGKGKGPFIKLRNFTVYTAQFSFHI